MERTLGLHPGSSLLKNLKKKRTSINTLDKFGCKSSCSESLFFLQKKGKMDSGQSSFWLLCYHNK